MYELRIDENFEPVSRLVGIIDRDSEFRNELGIGTGAADGAVVRTDCSSHRRQASHTATAEWLERIGMPYDDLHCSFDKVSRCVELGIDVLVDDSPVNLAKAKRAGMVAATIIHPWNEHVVEAGDAIGAVSWEELRTKLAPVLA